MKTNSNEDKPVILLSPPHEKPIEGGFQPFQSLSRKLSSLSLRSSPSSPKPDINAHHLLLPDTPIIKNSNIMYSPTLSHDSSLLYLPPSPQLSACATPTSERAQPAVLLQDKYKHYKKGKVIGRGATAKLRLLESKGHALMAIKTFHKRHQKDETEKGYAKRMTSEFCISKTLDHTHIIKVFDLLKDKKGRWCTVMEYCPGGDVFSILQQVDMTDEAMDCLFKQLLLGVQHIHASGVAHRDIKPENLVMTTSGILKIADFGVADVVQSCFDGEAKTCRGRCGSEPYWPPEVWENDQYDGRAFDIWSCAVTWHCIVFRQIPFYKSTREDPHYVSYINDFPSRMWIPLSKCNAEEKECLYGMFEKDPQKRWTVDQCLESTWLQSVSLCYESSVRHKHHFTL